LEPGIEKDPSNAAEEPAEPRQSTPFLVLQFFIFPMAIVAVCVTVFVIFGLIAGESHGAREYLAEVRSGGANRRWQAAFELSKVLQAGKDPALKDPKFGSELCQLFADSANDDPRVRRYLALAMGRLGDRRAVALLRAAVADEGQAGRPADADTQIYAIWALGAIGDPTALPDLVRVAASSDAGLRKAAVHALGAFPGDESRQALVGALADAVEDVRWNAAIALARRGDLAATPVFLTLLDRGHLDQVEGLRPDQREDVMLQAVAVAPGLADPGVRAAVARLRDSDPSLKVREGARKALEGQGLAR
jgi:HEAT repeat protein/nitrate reductase NapE component